MSHWGLNEVSPKEAVTSHISEWLSLVIRPLKRE